MANQNIQDLPCTPNLEECLRHVIKLMRTDATSDTDLIMQGVHWMWKLVCGPCFGHSMADLRSAAEHFPGTASRLAGEFGVKSAEEVGSMGAGFALLRRSEFKEAAALFSTLRFTSPAAAVVGVTNKCMQGFSLALAREHEASALAVEKAREAIRILEKPGRCLPGLLALTEALLAYECGSFSLAFELLEAQRHAFYSPFHSDLKDFPGFEAESLLLRAKIQREQGYYEKAWEAARQASHVRNETDDLLGKAWDLVEMARNNRFRGTHQTLEHAVQELSEAEKLLEKTDFRDWQARILDQRGDVYRAMKKHDLARKCYDRAETLVADSTDPFLLAHIANSRIRLLEDDGEYLKALKLAKDNKANWLGKKEYGKHLYLRGSLQWRLDNWGDAEKYLRRAREEFRRYGMRTHEALALDRLAQVFTDPKRHVTDNHKTEACKCWGEALRISTGVETETILKRIEQNAANLRVVDMLTVVAGLSTELKGIREKEHKETNRREMGQRALLMERYCLSHWLARTMQWHLDGNDAWKVMPPAIRNLCHLINAGAPFNWAGQDFSHSPARHAESIDLWALARTSGDEVARSLQTRLSIKTPAAPHFVWAQHECLRQAFFALFRGAHSAFGSRCFRLSLSDGLSMPDRDVIRIVLADPEPAGFDYADRLRGLEAAWTDKECRHFFEKGYTGDLSVLWYLVEAALWGKLVFDTQGNAMVISLPRAEQAAARAETNLQPAPQRATEPSIAGDDKSTKEKP